MKYKAPKQKYTTISVSEDFMTDIKEYLSKNSSKYISIADFAREAIREKIKHDNRKYFLDTYFTNQDGKPNHDIRDQRILQLQDENITLHKENSKLKDVIIELQKKK